MIETINLIHEQQNRSHGIDVESRWHRVAMQNRDPEQESRFPAMFATVSKDAFAHAQCLESGEHRGIGHRGSSCLPGRRST
jgi:hypothetical protein